MGESEKGRLYRVESIFVRCLLFLTLYASLVTVSHAELVDRVVAYVNDRAITLSELRATYERTKKLQPDISMREVLDTTVNRLLLLSDARRLKMEAKTEEETLSEYVDLKVRAFIRVREEEIEDYYRKNEKEFAGAPFESVRDRIEDLLTEKEINRLLKVQIEELRSKAYVRIFLKPTEQCGDVMREGGLCRSKEY
jgi:hypothetical protein